MFYVYELIDPRDGKPFYVGKGKGSRVHQHEKEAQKGSQGAKCDRIRDIVECGEKVAHRIVERFTDEIEAYAFEADHIAEIGLSNLTNVAAGGGTPSGLGNLVEDVRLARGLRKIGQKTANFTRFPKFLRLGGELHPLGACYVLPFALMRDKLLKRRGPEWVANYVGTSRA